MATPENIMVEYIKLVHITCAVLTGLSFFGRGLLMLADSPWLGKRFFKIAPHLVDTLLLVSAVALVTMGAWNPLYHPWLLAKMIALIVYIGLGMMAFRFAKTQIERVVFWVLALAVLLQIYVFAFSKVLWFYEMLI